jgi:7-keto-8-aminopelargonate synthetase-like enzyme
MRSELRAAGLDPGTSRTQILPVVVGEADRATALCERALEYGVFAQAIRPPTVPQGTSRLRLTVMATHRRQELRRAARTLAAAARELALPAGGAGALHEAA